MSPISSEFQRLAGGFPRVSGDEPGGGVYRRTRDWFSPRERG